jgi:hypothetical protein
LELVVEGSGIIDPQVSIDADILVIAIGAAPAGVHPRIANIRGMARHFLQTGDACSSNCRNNHRVGGTFGANAAP